MQEPRLLEAAKKLRKEVEKAGPYATIHVEFWSEYKELCKILDELEKGE